MTRHVAILTGFEQMQAAKAPHLFHKKADKGQNQPLPAKIL